MNNLILTTVDCLRADHLGCYGYPLATTPRLDAMCRDSWRFERAIVAGLPTFFSFPSIMASRYPLALGRNVCGLAPGETTLAAALSQAGFATAAFVAGNPYLGTHDGYDQGFEHFEDFLASARAGGELDGGDGSRERSSGRRSIRGLLSRLAAVSAPTHALWSELEFQAWSRWGRSEQHDMAALRRYPAADEVIRSARGWLDERSGDDDRPFFLWIHLMDPHHPYYPPEEALAEIGRGDLDAGRAHLVNAFWDRDELSAKRRAPGRRDAMALYDAGVRWADEQLGGLVEHLRRSGLWDDTLFAVTADHGEGFLEHGERYHFTVNLGPEVSHVPLLVHPPRHVAPAPAGGTVPGLFSLIDLAPTLLAMSGVEVPASFNGTSRFRDGGLDLGTTPAITECIYNRRNPWRERGRNDPRLTAVQDARYKLVVNFATGNDQLFDLEADPGELSPLAPEVGRHARRDLAVALLEHLRRSRPDGTRRDVQRAQIVALARTLAPKAVR